MTASTSIAPASPEAPAASAAQAAAAPDTAASAGAPTDPEPFLARAVPGAVAARALAPMLVAEVAASVGWTPAKLQRALESDAALSYIPPAPGAGGPGALVYSCGFGRPGADRAWLGPPAGSVAPGPAAAAGGLAAKALTPPGQGDNAPSEAFKLHR